MKEEPENKDSLDSFSFPNFAIGVMIGFLLSFIIKTIFIVFGVALIGAIYTYSQGHPHTWKKHMASPVLGVLSGGAILFLVFLVILGSNNIISF